MKIYKIAIHAIITLLLTSSALAQNQVSNILFLPAEKVPANYLAMLPQDLQLKLEDQERSRNPIPADSDHLVFIIDSSGSMFNYAWPDVIDQISFIINQYPNLQNFQVMNDMGEYLIPDRRREWINATETEIEGVLERLQDFNAFSNSSPIEGINEALDFLIAPSMAASIYILGDELAPATSPEALVRLVSDKEAGVRIHAKMFPVYFSQPARYQIVARNFAEAMVEIAEITEASFEVVE